MKPNNRYRFSPPDHADSGLSSFIIFSLARLKILASTLFRRRSASQTLLAQTTAEFRRKRAEKELGSFTSRRGGFWGKKSIKSHRCVGASAMSPLVFVWVIDTRAFMKRVGKASRSRVKSCRENRFLVFPSSCFLIYLFVDEMGFE